MRGVAEVECTLKRVPTVLEIGPGIHPKLDYALKTYVAVEPHDEYAALLRGRGLIVFQCRALDVLKFIRGVDSILLIDVLEHMGRGEGENVLQLSLEKAEQQVAVFTPLGFQEQSYKEGEKDAWGMNGQYWQTHRSGWKPEDFPGFDVGVNPDFHGLGKGAIFAVHTR
jgi:hypothetical protein